VKAALDEHRTDPESEVPWSGFDLINAFNSWKTSEKAGRIFVADAAGVIDIRATGLAWRKQVCQQVFEEAAMDCGRALAAWTNSRNGTRRGRRIGFPRFKKKNAVRSFRLRNKHRIGGTPTIQVGSGHPRSVTLTRIGTIRVFDDTRPLRRLLTKGRARVLFAAINYRAGKWWISLTVEAADLHPAHKHIDRAEAGHEQFVGIDRGLTAFLVAATSDGTEVVRIADPPKPLAKGIRRQRRLAKSLSRKKEGSSNRIDAATRLARHHRRIRNIRWHFLHEVSNALVKTHDRLVIEDLNVTGMQRNPRLAQAISDASWAEFARMLRYKQAWRSGKVETAERWFPSSKRCSVCQAMNKDLSLSDRVFSCPNGHRMDRDLNAAVNLAAWAQSQAREPEARAPVTKAHRREGAGRQPSNVGETSPKDVGTHGSLTAPAP
jgi:putative transposase